MHLHRVTLHPESFPTRERYPFCLPVFQQTPAIELTAPVTFFVGENGTGKSTLLRAVARRCGIHLWEGERRERFEHNPHERQLYRFLRVAWADGRVPGSYFASQEFQSYARLLDEWAAATPGILDYYGGASLMTQSHGQSLMAYFRSRYAIKGLYFADEPETALSPRTQLELLDVLAAMARAGHAQFLIATHSPILLSCPGAAILSFDRVPIQPVAYEDTDQYRVYRDFFVEPARGAARE